MASTDSSAINALIAARFPSIESLILPLAISCCAPLSFSEAHGSARFIARNILARLCDPTKRTLTESINESIRHGDLKGAKRNVYDAASLLLLLALLRNGGSALENVPQVRENGDVMAIPHTHIRFARFMTATRSYERCLPAS